VSYLSSVAHAAGIQELDARTQLDRLMKDVRTREPLYRKVDSLTSGKAIARLDMYKPDPNPQLWILLGTDGGTNHAMGVIGECVFSSNVPNALKLTKK
jgi:hypothetical protein